MDVFYHWIESLLAGSGTGTFGVLLLVGISFLLGLSHTFGPGHGKSLLLGVLVADSRRLGHALTMALVIGITHMLDVIVLSLVSIVVVATLSLEAVSTVLGWMSGAAILSLGLYRVYVTIRTHERTESTARTAHAARRHREHQNLLTAFFYSLAPCPGAWILFMACVGLGKPVYGFVLLIGFTLGLLVAIGGIAVGIVYSFRRLESFLPRTARKALSVVSGLLVAALGGWLIYDAGHAHGHLPTGE